MKKQTYLEQLKDPRWQKRRLEIMSQNSFSCENCGDDSSQLHVHHKEYFKDKKLWEYGNRQLMCLCDSCHESFHSKEDLLKMMCSFLDLDGPFGRDIVALIIAGFMSESYEDIVSMMGKEFDTPYHRALHRTGGLIETHVDEILTNEKVE